MARTMAWVSRVIGAQRPTQRSSRGRGRERPVLRGRGSSQPHPFTAIVGAIFGGGFALSLDGLANGFLNAEIPFVGKALFNDPRDFSGSRNVNPRLLAGRAFGLGEGLIALHAYGLNFPVSVAMKGEFGAAVDVTGRSALR